MSLRDKNIQMQLCLISAVRLKCITSSIVHYSHNELTFYVSLDSFSLINEIANIHTFTFSMGSVYISQADGKCNSYQTTEDGPPMSGISTKSACSLLFLV